MEIIEYYQELHNECFDNTYELDKFILKVCAKGRVPIHYKHAIQSAIRLMTSYSKLTTENEPTDNLLQKLTEEQSLPSKLRQ